MTSPNPLDPSYVHVDLDGLDIYYDSYRTCFWVTNNRQCWIRVNTLAVQRRLAEQGKRRARQNNERVSEIDAFLTAIERSHDVDYASSLAGFKAGVYVINEHRILVRDSPKLIPPRAGQWDRLQGIISNMLGEDQQQYLFGWLKIAVESLYAHNLRPGQALVLAGPRACGKSLLQNIITKILGGRSHKPHRYMSGLTPFNAELFEAEHLMIEDEEASTDIRARRNFGTKIKEICANATQSCHPKHRTAIHLTPFWRLSASVNDEPENIMILPPIDESIEDKLIILKANHHLMPMPTATDKERELFWSLLESELPAFIDFLFKWKIPDDLSSQRYGVTHFHHPDILEALGAFSPENRLHELIEAQLFNSAAPGSWQGTAAKLERELTAHDSKVQREANKLFTFPAACGTYLGRLQKLHKDHFEPKHTKQGNVWTIHPSKNGEH
jgi:hypothetical protein